MTIVKAVALACAGFALLTGTAQAIDLVGLWASDTEACGKIFVTKGKQTAFRRDADMFGSGFVIEGRRIRGRMANCTVTKTTEEKDVVHMLAACATDIMLSNVQFSVKVLDDNRIVRIFPGIEGMELIYHRCPGQRK
jgi:hypothetical protein